MDFPFDVKATCDTCGEVGAYDVYGDWICNKCLGPQVEVIVPGGMFGAWEGGDALDSVLRRIALAIPNHEGNWAGKYGAEYDCDVFAMHPFCWCEKADCPWCNMGDENGPDYKEWAKKYGWEEGFGAPNFWHKKSGLRVYWYKYIGRDTEFIGTLGDLEKIEKECKEAINASAAQ